MLKLAELTFGPGKNPLTAPLSIQFEAGQCVAIIGRNGVGKSTLLRTICGLLKPISGTVLLNDSSIAQLRRKELARHVAVVLTSRPDTGLLSVRDVVAMGRMPYTPATGRLSETDKEAVDTALSLCGLKPLEQRVLSTLSDGERQRAMIAKALAQTTQTILLDEPTAFLDYVAKEDVFSLLANLAHQQDKLILLTTHDLAAAHKYADHVLELSAEGLQPHKPSDTESRH